MRINARGLDDELFDRARLALARRVRDLRKARALTQAAAAQAARVDQALWSRVEHAQANPTLESLLGIQRALGAPSIESLFGEFPTSAFTAPPPP